MRRIDKAFSVFKGKARCEIIPNYCPYNVDPRLPDVDGNTYREETECREQGCRGISCEDCWDTELPQRPARIDWTDATDEDVDAMTIAEAIFIVKRLSVNVSETHVAKALQIIINKIDQHSK